MPSPEDDGKSLAHSSNIKCLLPHEVSRHMLVLQRVQGTPIQASEFSIDLKNGGSSY